MKTTVKKASSCMSRKAVLILLIIVSAFCLSQAQNGIIKGKVQDLKTKSPVAGADISILKDGKTLSGMKTDVNGEFTAKSLLAGKYSVMVVCSGYSNALRKDVTVKANETVTVVINLISVVTVSKMEEKDKNKNDKSCKEQVSFCAPVVSCDGVGRDAGGIVYNSIVVGDVIPEDFNTESYDKINENTFKDVLNDPLSTFSIDVDKASYSNVRRFLNNNQKPYKDAVRIEEMINYFDYDYPQPSDEHPFSITMEMGKCPWNDKHDLVLIGLKGEDVSTENIPAGNLVFLVDVSGSMQNVNKLPLIKQAFKILIDNLRPEDKVAIVVYAGAAGVVLESTSGKDKEKIKAAIEMLQAGGCTAGGEGINLAYKIAKENFILGGNNRVILATDGDFNIGASSDAEMVRLIEEKRKDNIFLSILGFGMGNYKDSKMEKIADAGNGNYAYIDNIIEAKKVFGKELWGTLYTIAKDVKIQIEFNPEKVKSYRLIGYENRILNKEDFNNDKKDAGDIGSGHCVTALYEIIRAGSDENVSSVDPLEYQQTKVVKSDNLMTVKLRYKKPDEDESKLIVKKLKENEINRKNASCNFLFAASFSEFGMLLRESENKANSSYEQVLALAKQSSGNANNEFKNEYIKLVETAELLSK